MENVERDVSVLCKVIKVLPQKISTHNLRFYVNVGG